MAIEIKVPVLPESVADASIATWHVKAGDKVTRDQNLVDIETDKVVLEVVAPQDGEILEIIHAEGDTVLGEQIIAKLGEAGEAPVAPKASNEQSSAPAADNQAKGEKVQIKVPVLPESVADATIATWHAQPGDAVKRDQNLVDIETDKVVLEVVAPEDGVLSEILEQEGATVLGEQVIGELTKGEGAAAPAPAAAEETTSEESSDALTPSVRRALAENGISTEEASKIKATGEKGRLTKEDVAAYVKAKAQRQASADASQPQAAPVAAGDRSQKRVPMTRLRKRVAERLLDAKNSTAMLTTFNEVNMKPIMDIRKVYQESFEKKHGIRIGFMSFFVKAVTEALKRFPEVNASIDGDDIVYHNYFDVSIAVSTPRGLVTPVLKDTDQLSLAEMEKGIRELAIKGRDGKLTIEEMTGGNFTITNGGVFGSLISTPIINPPQTAILGMHKIQERPMAVNGKVEILPMMYLALSYDHRLVDGKESVGFLVTIKELLEDPTRLLLDL
ncbi:2-oxoglutarate dehydrogenase, E2 subunit, dihydrolipoamide succinyltransferase [Catenovulum agarivorans DS-2]|uniref:Dihydrolipoyllysine-residue succinyltransferase component of 2-oxoglutarate dehydrogenase complex n=1 Tax=Catenovulum agarivorans DS-2 TaxID=1328313 RepID=W7QH81_9ALTE|nr:2-oxoglutarate dehydrogenase complex dihydrolipoyllysine-residue succinyltransferase [Catenovulum agarivorans]EWH12304.1 2-oxoglutarate dehydrogenase, E2 subunit, dihydrolipoamide succinyltransferase [Catenovulum agarivorans DS-2]